jgi:hypothetical protein
MVSSRNHDVANLKSVMENKSAWKISFLRLEKRKVMVSDGHKEH